MWSCVPLAVSREAAPPCRRHNNVIVGHPGPGDDMRGDERSRPVDGRVALVTGASQGGIGTAIAVRLAAEGALVAISGRSQRGLDDCREQIRAAGGACAVLPADL